MEQIDLAVQRREAIHKIRAGQSAKEVSESLNRHENWVRKWWKRYQAEGWDGLQERSRAPKRHGKKMSTKVTKAICRARSELEAEAALGIGLKYIGPLAVRTRLKEKKIKPLPSRASIERVLKANGMTRTKQKKRESKVKYPHLKPSRAHQLYQGDIVPHFLKGGQRIACFNAIDVVSRYPTGLPFERRRSQEAAEFLVHLCQEMGIAQYTQFDNEGCFSGGTTHKNVLGKVVRLALHIGTELIFSPIYHPQSNGTVERFHQDYDLHVWQDTYLHRLGNVQDQSATFFNLYRHSTHHSALKDQTPAEIHNQQPPAKLPADFVLPTAKLPLRDGRIHFIRLIDPDGTVKVLNSTWLVPNSNPLKGVWVTIDFQQSGASLTIYDAAPDVDDRRRLATYPFPLKEPILPHPNPSEIAEMPALPVQIPPSEPIVPRLLLALVSRLARFTKHHHHTIH